MGFLEYIPDRVQQARVKIVNKSKLNYEKYSLAVFNIEAKVSKKQRAKLFINSSFKTTISLNKKRIFDDSFNYSF